MRHPPAACAPVNRLGTVVYLERRSAAKRRAGARGSLESAIAHAILARVAAWNDGTVLPPPVAIEAPQSPIAAVSEAPMAAVSEATIAPVREVPAVAEQPPETRTEASWTHWLAIADAWDALFATGGEARAGGDAFDTQAHAFTDRLEAALNFCARRSAYHRDRLGS